VISRALIYSYLSGINSTKIDKNSFLMGCTKFGLDSPIPCITLRLATYGNSIDAINYISQIKSSVEFEEKLFTTTNDRKV